MYMYIYIYTYILYNIQILYILLYYMYTSCIYNAKNYAFENISDCFYHFVFVVQYVMLLKIYNISI